MDSKPAASQGGKLKLSCSIRIKPCGSSQSGIDGYDGTMMKFGGTKLGPFTSIIGP